MYSLGTLLNQILNTITDILTFNWQPTSQFDDFSARPLDGQKLLSPVDNNIALTTNQTYFPNIGTRIGMSSSSDAQPYVPPKVPSLYTALTTSGDVSLDPATYGVGTNPWVLKSGQVVQINYYNADAFPHPLHLHVSCLIFVDYLIQTDVIRVMFSRLSPEGPELGTATKVLYQVFRRNAMSLWCLQMAILSLGSKQRILGYEIPGTKCLRWLEAAALYCRPSPVDSQLQ